MLEFAHKLLRSQLLNAYHHDLISGRNLCLSLSSPRESRQSDGCWILIFNRWNAIGSRSKFAQIYLPSPRSLRDPFMRPSAKMAPMEAICRRIKSSNLLPKLLWDWRPAHWIAFIAPALWDYSFHGVGDITDFFSLQHGSCLQKSNCQ